MLTLDELREDAKTQAMNWEIDWDVIDSDISCHEDFKQMLSWADTVDLDGMEKLYEKLCEAVALGNQYFDPGDGEPFDLSDMGNNKYLAECEKSIREAYILRDLHERYNLIMSITEGV